MDRNNRDEFFEATAKSHKRHHDDQDPPPPPPDSDQNVPIPDDVNISDSEDTSTVHLPSIKTKADWFKPADSLAKSYKDPKENKLLSKIGDMGSCIKWYCKWIRKKKLTKADLEGVAYMTVKPFHTNNISLQFQMEECHWLLTDKIDLMNPKGYWVVPDVSKPLPLGGPPSQVTIQPHFFFNRDLEYLVLGDNERMSALSISKLKVTHYLDFGLKELVSSLWIKSEHDYDISAAYGITHCVTCLKTYERYGYTYLREIVLRRADYNEYKISKADFKNLHPNDFEDLYLLHPQGKLNHLPGSDKVHLFNAVNMWIKNIVIRQCVADFKTRAIIYRDRSDQKKMMRLNENPVMEIRIWSEDDRRRSKEFMEVIERRLNIRRIFKSRESFVSGRSDTYTGNPAKEILLKLNLPDHRSVLTNLEVQVKMEMEIPHSSEVNFITAYSYSTDKSKDVMKA
ncbi:hypothetical protein Tco_1190803 [Tanacetum coccineum]